MKSAVIDLGFGDSGKGTTVAFLSQFFLNSIVVRFSGGHQAGHTVVKDGMRHVFSSFGSGTLQNIPTFWSKNCTFSPYLFLEEYERLNKLGIKPVIYVDSRCPITTFAEVQKNIQDNEKNSHGSCGLGFGATLQREEDYFSLTVGDLKYPVIVKEKLKLILQHYYPYVSYNDDEFNNFLVDCFEARKFIGIVNENEIDEFLDGYPSIIYEGSQGLLLDKDIGFFPHVTRANVGSKGIGEKIHDVYYVTRAYQTRHGNGPMANENIPHNIIANPNETNVSNYQGEFRRSLLDIDMLKYAIEKDNAIAKIKNLVITCMDHVKNDLRFTKNGVIINCLTESEFVSRIAASLNIDGVYLSYSEEFKNIKRAI